MDGPLRRPTDSSLRSGTPSPSEVPSGGASAFCLLLRFSKVSRRQGGTLSGRYRRNGYVLNPIQHPGRPRGRHRGQAPSHIWTEVYQMGCVETYGYRGQALPPSVGASLLAKNSQAPRSFRKHALSLTFFASKLAPTGLCGVFRWRRRQLQPWRQSDRRWLRPAHLPVGPAHGVDGVRLEWNCRSGKAGLNRAASG